MKRIKILFSQDCSHCECCGYNYDDYGVELWLNDEKIIDKPASASCFGNGSDCYSAIDQIDLIANSLKIPISKFYKLDNDWTDEEKDSEEYDEYYYQVENNVEEIVKRILIEFGYSVEISNKLTNDLE